MIKTFAGHVGQRFLIAQGIVLCLQFIKAIFIFLEAFLVFILVLGGMGIFVNGLPHQFLHHHDLAIGAVDLFVDCGSIAYFRGGLFTVIKKLRANIEYDIEGRNEFFFYGFLRQVRRGAFLFLLTEFPIALPNCAPVFFGGRIPHFHAVELTAVPADDLPGENAVPAVVPVAAFSPEDLHLDRFPFIRRDDGIV